MGRLSVIHGASLSASQSHEPDVRIISATNVPPVDGRDTGVLRIADSLLASDGDLADILRLHFDSPLYMDGRSVILQASRKIPRAISELLERNSIKPAEVGTFVVHQANLNLITRVAAAIGVEEARFVRNVSRYGNTSSASMLIAAAEAERLDPPVVFAAFGAGLNWGAVLAVKP